MATPMQQQFALLIGVDLYLNGDSRLLPNGSSVSLRTLEGAVNDVESIHGILRRRFRSLHPYILTSSPSLNAPDVPKEPEDEWPTHVNIKKAFDDIRSKAQSGDVFFFHFSGHGAVLPTTLLPSGNPSDPSLMTMDYCRGKPAVRGWELNEWLQEFNSKDVRVIVLLDSCYSGGAWRAGERVRSPENWIPPPNLPSDEAAVQATQKKPGHRDGNLDQTWNINPKDFTLIAACQSTEKAAERDERGLVNGAFTLALHTCLQEIPIASFPTYRALRDRTTDLLVAWNISQKPQVFGQDRLAFLADYEAFHTTPIRGTMQESRVSLPVGKIHSISEGTEFITTPAWPKAIISVSEVDDCESKADIVNGAILDPKQSVEFVPLRWNIKNALIVVIDPRLGQGFQERLASALEDTIAGEIQYQNEMSLTSSDSNAVWFRLEQAETDNVDIFGPERLIGYKGPVRGWKKTEKTTEGKAKQSAVAITHLTRFGQILHLRNQFQDTKPFDMKFEFGGGENQQKSRCMFQNNKVEELHFAVFILSPGFHVRQLFPRADTLEAIPPYGSRSFTFDLEVPDELRSNEVYGQQYVYRDVIRTFVSRGKNLSLKSIELPDIWDADKWNEHRASGPSRDAKLSEEYSWWIQDDEKLTT